MKFSPFTLLIALTLILSSCEKDKDPEPSGTELSNPELQNKILNDFAYNIALATYVEMESKMNIFYLSCVQFDSTLSQQDLISARNAWKNVRSVWEQSEAFLFGPVSTDNIDPGIDTWPIDHNSLDSLFQTSVAFTQGFMNSLDDGLKGYHPAEFILWGVNGNKVPADFTSRERVYLIALVTDLNVKATFLRASWDPATTNNYSLQIINAGQSGSVYPSQRSVFEEIVNAMIGICDEVSNGKIYEPFAALDPSLEESPYSMNSLIDFRNNLQGVKNVYFGDFLSNGNGLNDFMSKNNLSIHSKISNQIENALNSFNGITAPFNEAIISQRPQVQNVINQINTLKLNLEDELLPFIQQTITE